MTEKKPSKKAHPKNGEGTSRSGYSDRELMYTVDPYIKGDHAVIRQVNRERVLRDEDRGDEPG